MRFDRLGRGLRPGLSSGAKHPPNSKGLPVRQTRKFVNSRVLQLLKQTMVGQASIAAFKFQNPAQCEPNSLRMQRETEQALVDLGVIFKPCDDLMASTHDLSGSAIMELNHKHGPLLLKMQRLLQPDQGADAYPAFHAAVLVASFLHEGRRIGVLLDGNDLQSNPAMKTVMDYMAVHADERKLSALTAHDFERMNEEMQRQGCEEVDDVMQVGFRLVDLDEMATASDKEYKRLARIERLVPVPNICWYNESAEVVEPLVPSSVQDELRKAIQQESLMVERFMEEL